MNTRAFSPWLTASGFLCLFIFLNTCGGVHTATPAGPVPQANTTLQAETGNNTSAADSFSGQTNGNAPAANVSKFRGNLWLIAQSAHRLMANC